MWQSTNREKVNAKHKEWYKVNKDKVLEKCRDYHKRYRDKIASYKKDWQVEDKQKYLEKHILMSAKDRAKRRNLDFDITIEDIVVPDVCPVLGIPIFVTNGSATDNSPSLDRIDNTKGYVKGNVFVISNRANTLKRDGNIIELAMIIDYIKRNSPIDNEDYSI